MMFDMSSPVDLVSAAEASTILGVSRPTLSRLARSGALTEVVKAPGLRGARLFFRDDVQRLKRERAA